MRLKWGQTEYKGRLISVDSYMNIQLSNTEEFIDMKSTGTLGQVLIRYEHSALTLTRVLTRSQVQQCTVDSSCKGCSQASKGRGSDKDGGVA